MPHGRPAAEDDHARRRGHRAGHRVVVVPQRPAARVGARARGAHRRRAGGGRRPRGPEHADLFRAFPNSYGTLGYALRLVIDLEPVHPFVRLRHVRFHDLDALTAAIGAIVADRSARRGAGGLPRRHRLHRGRGLPHPRVLGRPGAVHLATTPAATIYYRSIQQRTVDYLTVRDYLWRWDTDWFWCSRAFGAQNPRIRRLWPKRWLRSDVYWKLIRLENRLPRRGPAGRPQGAAAARAGGAGRRDPARPHRRLPATGSCARCRSSRSGCARCGCATTVRRRCSPRPAAGRRGRSTRLRPDETYVNVGFWSTVAIEDGRADGDVNRLIEAVVAELGGHKSLYSDAYYERGRVLGALRRRGLPRGEEALRPAVAAARPVREGGAADDERSSSTPAPGPVPAR